MIPTFFFWDKGDGEIGNIQNGEGFHPFWGKLLNVSPPTGAKY